MSNFECSKCNKMILDTSDGYITGCEHYPIEKIEKNKDELLALSDLMDICNGGKNELV